MKTYARQCKQKNTKTLTEDVFFAEKAFRSPLELSTTVDDESPKATSNSKGVQSKNPAGNKRKRSKADAEATKKKPKTKPTKEPAQRKKKVGTGKIVSKAEQAVLESDSIMELASLPLLNETPADKVNSWLENCVDDVSPSVSDRSIENWRQEGRSPMERELSLFPEAFYKNLGTKSAPKKKPEVRKEMGAEINAFLQSLHLAKTPIQKSQHLRGFLTKMDEANQSELSSNTGTQSGADSSKLPESTTFETAETKSTSCKPFTQSSTQLYSTDYVTETQSNLQSTELSSYQPYSTEFETEGSSGLQKDAYSSKKSSTLYSSKQSSTRPSTMMSTQSSTRFRSTGLKRTLSDEVSKSREFVPQRTPDKPTQFKLPKSKGESTRGKKVSPVDPKTSTKLFDGDTVDIEEAFAGVSKIINIDASTRRKLSEKTPNKPTEFKSPKSPKKAPTREKTVHHLYPKTSTRLFDGDTINIEDVFPSNSTIKNDRTNFKDENTDFLSPAKCKAPVKTSTPQDKHPSGRSLHFEMDISSVNQDSEDDELGLHIEQTFEVNSMEIVALSPSESVQEPLCLDQDDSSRRNPEERRRHGSSRLFYTSRYSHPSQPSSNFPTDDRQNIKVKVSVKNTGNVFDSKNILDVPVCPLMTQVQGRTVKTAANGGKVRWIFASSKEIAMNKNVPMDILCQ